MTGKLTHEEVDAAAEDEARANAEAWAEIDRQDAQGLDPWQLRWAFLDDALARYAADHPKYKRTTWYPEDLADALDGSEAPSPSVLARGDGACLLYEGKAHSFFGDYGSMKTWAALLAVKHYLDCDETVFYVDCESDRRTIGRRLLQVGVPAETILHRLLYVRPDGPLDDNARVDFWTIGRAFRARLVVLDGMTEFMALHGLNPNDALEVAKAQHMLVRAPSLQGVTRVVVDHVAKGKGGRPTALGSQHKTAGIDGAAYYLDLTETGGVGGTSRARIVAVKDRDARVFPTCSPPAKYGTVGTLVIDPDGIRIEAPADIGELAMDRILAVVPKPPETITVAAIGEMTQLGEKHVRNTLNEELKNLVHNVAARNETGRWTRYDTNPTNADIVDGVVDRARQEGRLHEAHPEGRAT